MPLTTVFTHGGTFLWAQSSWTGGMKIANSKPFFLHKYFKPNLGLEVWWKFQKAHIGGWTWDKCPLEEEVLETGVWWIRVEQVLYKLSVPLNVPHCPSSSTYLGYPQSGWGCLLSKKPHAHILSKCQTTFLAWSCWSNQYKRQFCFSSTISCDSLL